MKEAKHVISETFFSIEGEAKYNGHPTAYVRYSRCNFTCVGFNNPTMQKDSKGYAPLDFNIIELKSLDDVPDIQIGCDSQYAVNPAFSHIWHTLTTSELAQRLVDMLPNKSWIYPSGQRIALSLTGGEPSLQWKIIPQLLNDPLLADVNHVIFETNCAVPINQKFIDQINQWVDRTNGKWTWSNSPKLLISGEEYSKAIRPDIALMQRGVKNCDQYFKFVCGDSDKQFEEVAFAMDQYHDGGIPPDAPIYIMPMACTEEQQNEITTNVAVKCMHAGYIYCHRIHLDVFGNAIGT